MDPRNTQSPAEKLLDEILLASEQATPLKSARKCMLEVLERGMAEQPELQAREADKATIAGLETSVGHLSAMVDELRGKLDYAMAAMKFIEQIGSPIDESRGDFDCRIPAMEWRAFVDARARLLAGLNHLAPSCPECVFGVCYCAVEGGQKMKAKTAETTVDIGFGRGGGQTPAQQSCYCPGCQESGKELDVLRLVSNEYNAWIHAHAAGVSYDEFLKQRLAANVTPKGGAT